MNHASPTVPRARHGARSGAPARKRADQVPSAASSSPGSANSMIGGLIMPEEVDRRMDAAQARARLGRIDVQVDDRLVVDQPIPRVGRDAVRAVGAGLIRRVGEHVGEVRERPAGDRVPAAGRTGGAI